MFSSLQMEAEMRDMIDAGEPADGEFNVWVPKRDYDEIARQMQKAEDEVLRLQESVETWKDLYKRASEDAANKQSAVNIFKDECKFVEDKLRTVERQRDQWRQKFEELEGNV